MKLMRKNKIEFNGNKKQLIEYIRTRYCDDFWVDKYSKILSKDRDILMYVIENLGMQLK